MDCLHHLFEAQAERTPRAVAIECGPSRLSYRGLDRRANRLAHHLRGAGVGTGDMVGVCVDSGPDLVTAILGVWKAGAAYLGLDTALPAGRIVELLRESGARFVVIRPQTAAAIAKDLPPSVRLMTDAFAVEGLPDRAPGVRRTAGDLAYVIFTSGSTGGPKAVAVLHGGLAARATTFASVFGIGVEDRVLHLSPPTFDGIFFELGTVLTAGAALCIAPPDAVLPGRSLADTLRRERITVGLFVTSQLAALPAADLPALRVVVTGAESTPGDVVAPWVAPGRTIWNTYGTTEATIVSTAHRLRADEELPAMVPIGAALPGVKVYVLDPRGDPVEPGTPGELYVGGSGVALGYLRQPGLTAERFLPCPFGGEAGSRMFRTGDRVRALPGGALEFLGRWDSQVKVRGVRMDLEEIGRKLRRAPGVADCVVVADGEPGGRLEDRQLVAYVVPREDADAGPAAWRRSLERSLPRTMVPNRFVTLAELPVTSSGKLDRRALSAAAAGAQAPAPARRPRTATERALCRIWTEVLPVTTVDVDDDFFAVGGHSLAAARLIARVRDALGVDLPLRTLYGARTVEAVARAIDAGLPARSGSRLPAAEPPGSRGGRLPLSFAQERMWYLSRRHPGRYLTIPLAFRLRGRLDIGALRSAVGVLIARHEALRTRFHCADGVPTQEILPPDRVPAQVVELEAAGDAAAVAGTVGAFFRRPFDLEAETPLRVALLQRSETEWVLLVALHHICGDRWSTSVLLNELVEGYNAHASGRPVSLPEPPLRYSDFLLAQRASLADDGVRGRSLEYWRRQLAGAPRLEMPTDWPPRIPRTFEGSEQTFRLDPELTKAVRSLAAERSTTLFTALLAAFYVVLADRSGQRDLVVGTLVHGRPQPELRSVVGFFTNVLALRTDLRGQPSFAEVVDRVNETVLGAFEHEDLPFQDVVRELRPPRGRDSDPYFQVAFVFHDLMDVRLRMDGLQWGGEETPIEVANYDLILYVGDAFDGGVWGIAEYSRQLFAPATVSRLVDDYVGLVAEVVRSPGTPVAALAGGPRSPAEAQWAAGAGLAPGAGTRPAPRAETVRAVQRIWAEVLGVPHLSAERDVFEQGGHSLAALQVAARVGAELGVAVPVALVFEAPSIECFAARVDALRAR